MKKLADLRRKSNDKGFTLVELIVVLVILAILAAILVPALLGYIDRAKGQQIVLNARSVYTAAQAEATSYYAKGKLIGGMSDDNAAITRIAETADVESVCSSFTIGVKKGSEDTAHENYTVTYVYYEEGDQAVEFNGTSWETVDSQYDSLTAAEKSAITVIATWSSGN